MIEFFPRWLCNIILAAFFLFALFVTIEAVREGVIGESRTILHLVWHWSIFIVLALSGNVNYVTAGTHTRVVMWGAMLTMLGMTFWVFIG